MEIKKMILPIIFVLVLTASLCWAVPPYKLLLSDIRGNMDSVRGLSKNIELLSNRINHVTIEISNLSHEVNLKRKKAKIKRLEEKVNNFQQLVLELDNKTDILRGLASDLQNESNILLKASHINQDVPHKCGPGKIWIPRHRLNSGKWVLGHCANK